MKKFLMRLGFTVSIFFFTYLLFSYIIVNYIPYMPNQDWLRIKRRVIASQSKITKDTLYLGDSVAAQLLPFNNDNQLTSNACVFPIGNYFLLKNALENNPEITTVVYLSVPDALGLDLANEKTYPYFVKPFYNFQNRSEILENKEVSQILNRNKFLDCNLVDGFKLFITDEFNYGENAVEPKYIISEQSLLFIEKMASLCKKNNVDFIFKSPPVALGKKTKFENWSKLLPEKNNLSEKHLNRYFSNMVYYEDKYLKDDVHWKDDFLASKREEFLTKLFKNISKN